jgi:hypothetical protein
VVPSGTTTDPDIEISLVRIRDSEGRQDEVAYVTPIKAPELLTEFNKSWLEIHKAISILENENNKAQKAVDKRKGVLLLEIIPERLKSLGISSTADTREAVINTDQEYEDLTARLQQIEAALFFLKGKLKGFENAYTSVKKILGEGTFNFKQNPNLSGGVESAPTKSVIKQPTIPVPPKPAPTRAPGPGIRVGGGWGKANYGE